jgi:DNA-binding winged helix-turn-helix (wHTH) protein
MTVYVFPTFQWHPDHRKIAVGARTVKVSLTRAKLLTMLAHAWPNPVAVNDLHPVVSPYGDRYAVADCVRYLRRILAKECGIGIEFRAGYGYRLNTYE